MEHLDKKAVVERLERTLNKHMVSLDPTDPAGTLREHLARKRLKVQSELREIDFMEDAVGFLEKWEDQF